MFDYLFGGNFLPRPGLEIKSSYLWKVSMEYRKLELTVFAGQDIGPGLREGRVQVYALVSFNGDTATAQKTDVDREGGKNPIWNRTFTHTIPDLSVRDPGSEVVAKLFYQRNREDLFVGEVRIPIPFLFDRGTRSFVSFDVVPTGRLHIAYRFGEKSLVRNQSTLFKRWLILGILSADRLLEILFICFIQVSIVINNSHLFDYEFIGLFALNIYR